MLHLADAFGWHSCQTTCSLGWALCMLSLHPTRHNFRDRILISAQSRPCRALWLCVHTLTAWNVPDRGLVQRRNIMAIANVYPGETAVAEIVNDTSMIVEQFATTIFLAGLGADLQVWVCM